MNEAAKSMKDNAVETMDPGFLAADEPAPVAVLQPHGHGSLVIVCDHAGNLIPRSLEHLGLSVSDLTRHIAWDPGVEPLAGMLGEALGATVVLQRYSRLVIDCNRLPESPSSILAVSEDTIIPGNQKLNAREESVRARHLYAPYHQAVEDEIQYRLSLGRTACLVALHSFSPVYRGVKRPWDAGVVFGEDRRMSDVVLEGLKREEGLLIGENQPYGPADGVDHTMVLHAARRGLGHVMLEIRQDHLRDPAGRETWSRRVAPILARAARVVEKKP